MIKIIKISARSDVIIRELSHKTGKSKILIVEEALELYRFKERMRLFNNSYEKLRTNKEMWEQELKERNELQTS